MVLFYKNLLDLDLQFTCFQSIFYNEVCCLYVYGFFAYHIFSYSFVSVFYHCPYGCMFCTLLFNFVNYVFNFYVYVFFLLYMFSSVYSVSLCCSVYCLCVSVYCTTATGCQPNCSKQTYQYTIAQGTSELQGICIFS